MGYNVGYLINEGLKNVFKNKKSTIAALSIMAATMIIFGIFFMISENINNLVTELERSQGIEVFIKNGTTQAEVDEIGQKIKSLPGVNAAQFVTKQDAFEKMKEYFENNEELLEGLEDILPVSYVVTFTDLSLNYDVQNEISTWDNIKKITNKDETTNALMNIAKWIKIVSTIIIVFLIIVSIFIISNTIKLTVHARRKEISIMKYVGATNGFIRTPFIVEGIIIGIVAALFSLLVVGGIYNWVSGQLMTSALIEKLGFVALSFSDMLSLIIAVYAILGIGIGVLGSSISVRKYLDV